MMEQLDFDVFCNSLFQVLKVKKDSKSQSAEILRTVFLTICGEKEEQKSLRTFLTKQKKKGLKMWFVFRILEECVACWDLSTILFCKESRTCRRTLGFLVVAALLNRKRFFSRLETRLFSSGSAPQVATTRCRM